MLKQKHKPKNRPKPFFKRFLWDIDYFILDIVVKNKREIHVAKRCEFTRFFKQNNKQSVQSVYIASFYTRRVKSQVWFLVKYEPPLAAEESQRPPSAVNSLQCNFHFRGMPCSEYQEKTYTFVFF